MTASDATVVLTETMTVLARNAGDWYGIYLHFDTDGLLLDRHASHLTATFPPGVDWYQQTNRYLWDDGRVEEYYFEGRYQDGAVIFNTERIDGRAWEADSNTVVLKFTYKAQPGRVIYEDIHISDDGQHRTRVWHWLDETAEVYRYTLIKETRTRPE